MIPRISDECNERVHDAGTRQKAGRQLLRCSNPEIAPENRKRAALARVGSFLADAHPELFISKQSMGKVESIECVRLKRETAQQNIGFSSRPFVLCGLPVRKPPDGQLVYERRNGTFVLQITGHPEYGVPYGQDRIVPIFLASLAVRQKRQTIRFKTAAEMLETFGRHKDGKEYRRLVAAFERIFGATMFFGTDLMTSKAHVIQRSRFNFLREAQIWYNRRPDQRVLREDFENVIVLSDEFYQEIMAHPIPTDLEAVKVLASAPAVLDLFMWLRTAVFWPADWSRSQSSDPSVLSASSDRWSILARDDFEQCWRSGWA